MSKIYFDLTHEQKKAFNKLKSAYKACEKTGIFFVNNYGTLQGYDGSQIKGYADSNTYSAKDNDVISNYDFDCLNTFRIANEWTDDEHLIKLTEKGVRELI